MTRLARLDAQGRRLHQLPTGHGSVSVNGNWRMTFGFDGEDATRIDYEDYHYEE